jgi:hypothetical protein
VPPRRFDEAGKILSACPSHLSDPSDPSANHALEQRLKAANFAGDNLGSHAPPSFFFILELTSRRGATSLMGIYD